MVSENDLFGGFNQLRLITPPKIWEIKERAAHTVVEEDIAHMCLSETGQNKLINMMIGDVISRRFKLLPGGEALQNRWLIFTSRGGDT